MVYMPIQLSSKSLLSTTLAADNTKPPIAGHLAADLSSATEPPTLNKQQTRGKKKQDSKE